MGHRARTKEDDTTEAEAGAQARAAAKKARSAARKETTEEVRARARKAIVGAARRAGPSTEESNEAVKDNTMGRSLQNKKAERAQVAPPEAVAKARSTPHRARTKEDKTTEVAPPQAVAKALVKQKKEHKKQKKQDETTEEVRARARKAIVGAARRAGPSTEESNKAVKDNTMGRSLQNKKAARAQVAPPQAVAKARSTPHRARAKEDKTTEVAPPQAVAK